MLLSGGGELVFEGELLQGLAAVQRLALPLALEHLLQPEAHVYI